MQEQKQTQMSFQELEKFKKEYQKSSSSINQKINKIYEVNLKETIIGFLNQITDNEGETKNIKSIENIFKQMQQCIKQFQAAKDGFLKRQNLQKSLAILSESNNQYQENLRFIRRIIERNNEQILKSDLEGIVFRLDKKSKNLMDQQELCDEVKTEQNAGQFVAGQKAKQIINLQVITNNFDGVTPNFKKYNPMHYGALMGNQQEVEKELANGADINQLDKMGRNSLYFSLISKQTQMSKFLIQKGINYSFSTKDRERAIQIASSIGDLQIVQILARSQSVQSNQTFPPLMRAIRGKHIDVVKFLIQSGASINQNYANTTPLHEAIKLGNIEIVQLILSKDASKIDSQVGKGYYPIHYAILCQNLDLIKQLQKYGASMSVQGYRQYNVLHLAVKNDLYEITQYFINIIFNSGQSLDTPSRKNKTALHLAVKNQNYNIIELLIERGASVLSVTSQNNNPLHEAAKQGNIKIIEFLIKSGANLEQKNVFGQTPLDIASQRGFKDVAIYMRKTLNGIMT